jgi:hypothetical protein
MLYAGRCRRARCMQRVVGEMAWRGFPGQKMDAIDMLPALGLPNRDGERRLFGAHGGTSTAIDSHHRGAPQQPSTAITEGLLNMLEPWVQVEAAEMRRQSHI